MGLYEIMIMMQEQRLRSLERSYRLKMDAMNEDPVGLEKLNEYCKLCGEFRAKASASSGEEKISYQKKMGKEVIKMADLMRVSITDDEKHALEDGTDLLKIKQISVKVIKEGFDRLFPY